MVDRRLCEYAEAPIWDKKTTGEFQFSCPSASTAILDVMVSKV
jgi:hypothetical protein